MQIILKKIFGKIKEYLLLFILLIISLVVLTLNHNPKVKKIRTYAFSTVAVWAELFNYVTGSDSPEIKKLRLKNAELMLQVNKLHEYAFENAELKRLLNYKEKSDYKLIPATVLAKNISKTQGVYIINVGKKDSVAKGMPVITDKGLVGIITNVSNNYSLIRTLQNSFLKIAAIIPRSNIEGVVKWDGNRLVIENIPTTADINIGDRVVTSVLSTVFPPSIPVGLVAKKETNISGLLSNVTIKPFVNVIAVKNVFVFAAVQSKQINNLELNLLSK
jgi:rod shape-determining protein MreC